MPLTFTYADGFTVVKVGWDAQTGRIGHILLNRPDKSNAFNSELWEQFPRVKLSRKAHERPPGDFSRDVYHICWYMQAVKLLQQRDDIRVLVVSAAGKNFTAGLDLSYLTGTFGAKMQQQQACPARLRDQFRQDILDMQEAFSVLERCRFPVIAAVQGACVGAGVDLITAADLRYCSSDATFSVKEVDLAITADLGTLQRLPGIIGHGAAAELAFTARSVPGSEAAALGLVSRCYSSQADMMAAVMQLAQQLAAKSPLALAGTKQILLHTRDVAPGSGGVAAGLAHVALWNSAYLLSGDMQELVAARAQRRAPAYSKL